MSGAAAAMPQTGRPGLFKPTYIDAILRAMPSEWRGTTFNNSALLGRETFTRNLVALLNQKDAQGRPDISTAELAALGNAEDYLRVATNVSTTLEAALANTVGLPVTQVFSFASTTMPILAVMLAAKCPVHLYCGTLPVPFTPRQAAFFRELGGRLECHPGKPVARVAGERPMVVLSLEDGVLPPAKAQAAGVDGVVTPNLLYIFSPQHVPPEDVLVVRKRMSTPATTPMAEAMLRILAGHAEENPPDEMHSEVERFNAHLQRLSGTARDPSCEPVVFTAGLPTLSSLWLTLLRRGGADILMSSTAYGGSSQLTDLLGNAASKIRKHTFDIQGDAVIDVSIREGLARVSTHGKQPTTVLFVEIPTNPDQKVPSMLGVVAALQAHQAETGKQVLLLVDTTFSPGSQVLHKVQLHDPALPAMCFISLSKSVSRGITTGGALVANDTEAATELLHQVRRTAAVLDTTAKPDQVLRLVENHDGVERRCREAYATASAVGAVVQAAVRKHTGRDMPLAFVTPSQASEGFTSSTFSFNLPGLFSPDVNAGLAQRFVDLLTTDKQFKPCVSFGQDNGLVYCTVPATSTQGAIKEEDKAKQAVGGVQLVRLSFPPALDVTDACRVVESAVAAVYGGAKL